MNIIWTQWKLLLSDKKIHDACADAAATMCAEGMGSDYEYAV